MCLQVHECHTELFLSPGVFKLLLYPNNWLIQLLSFLKLSILLFSHLSDGRTWGYMITFPSGFIKHEQLKGVTVTTGVNYITDWVCTFCVFFILILYIIWEIVRSLRPLQYSKYDMCVEGWNTMCTMCLSETEGVDDTIPSQFKKHNMGWLYKLWDALKTSQF